MKRVPTRSIWLTDTLEANPVDVPLGDLLHQAAQSHPGREAVVYACQDDVESVRWSYQQLNEMADGLARALLLNGYRVGDRIAIWAPNSPEWILLEYALAKAGITIVALNPLYKKAELAYAIRASEVSGIFHAETVSGASLRAMIDAIRAEVPYLQGVYSLEKDIPRFLRDRAPLLHLPTVDPDSCLMIQFTSGTTGAPKAAQLSHRGVATIARNSYQAWGFREGDRVCHGFPLFHVGGSGNSTPGSALVGATTLPLYIFKALATLNILEQEACTGFIGVPSMLIAMMEHESFQHRDFSALKYIVIGGACVPASLIRKCEDAFGVDVMNSYGQTETSGVSTSTIASDPVEIKASTSGAALPGISLKIIDAQGDVLPVNSIGELCYRGPGTMMGYLERQEPPCGLNNESWLRSGDLATMTETGYISIVGRAKEMIIRGGENLSPPEIEGFLCEHPDIAEAAVVGLPDEKYGEEVCAVLIPTREDHSDADTIRQWCTEHLSRWKVPRYIIFKNQLPKTPSGKVQKFLLQEAMIAHFDLESEKTK